MNCFKVYSKVDFESRLRVVWDANTIGRAFGIIDEALYSMALYSEINPSNRDNTIFDPYLRKFWKMISDNAVLSKDYLCTRQ